MLVVGFLLTTLFLSFFVIASAAPILLHCNLKKHYSYFSFGFLTPIRLFYCLVRCFERLNKYTVPCLFVDRVQKRVCYLPVSSFISKTFTSNFFVICFSINVVSTIISHFNFTMLKIYLSFLHFTL